MPRISEWDAKNGGHRLQVGGRMLIAVNNIFLKRKAGLRTNYFKYLYLDTQLASSGISSTFNLHERSEEEKRRTYKETRRLTQKKITVTYKR
jgi:hypothetical protein